jgi:hypothetical protein
MKSEPRVLFYPVDLQVDTVIIFSLASIAKENLNKLYALPVFRNWGYIVPVYGIPHYFIASVTRRLLSSALVLSGSIARTLSNRVTA